MTKRKIWIGIAVLVLIWILVPLITLPRAKADVLSALESSLGRHVEAQDVRLHLLPLPAIELDQVSLAEDPAFGLEDMVVADSATANISLWALLHGRLVFSRVHLQDPSINLVRNRAGRWNIAALLQRTGHVAPSAGGGRPGSARFPYLEWSDARINFKFQQTKTHFYLDQGNGSLAREHSDWRLQAAFVPERSDVNLSDTGQVTIDGRWRAGAGSLQAAHFDLAVHIRNSYLAGSTALVLGHDSGLHGVLGAALRVAGTGQQFAVTGTVSARSLRRWDLLPPPASVSCQLNAVYRPGADTLEIIGIGDPGWRHFHLAGEVRGLFARPRASLTLGLHDFAAADVLPLALALKSHLPVDLAAAGTLNGSARLQWQRGQGLPTGQADLAVQQLRLSSHGDELQVPRAQLAWNGVRLRLAPTPAQFRLPRTSAALSLAANLDAQGFVFDLSSHAMNAGETRALAAMAGLDSPWPAQLQGTAKLALHLGASWPRMDAAHWTGSVDFQQARFQPPGSAGVLLRPLRVVLRAPAPLQARFALTAVPLAGSLSWTPGAGARFALHGESEVHSAALWALLHPAPGDLMQRMFGSVLGLAAPPAWLENLHAAGSVRLRRLDWHGIPVGLRMQVAASPQGWSAPRLQLALGGGGFDGSGHIAAGPFHIHGAVVASRPLSLAAVLAPTRYAGRLHGWLTGAITVSRPLQSGGWNSTEADGDFRIRAGRLATSTGTWRFQDCRGHLLLHQSHATLSALDCTVRGRHYRGAGDARFDAHGAVQFRITLQQGTHSLILRNPAPH